MTTTESADDRVGLSADAGPPSEHCANPDLLPVPVAARTPDHYGWAVGLTSSLLLHVLLMRTAPPRTAAV